MKNIFLFSLSIIASTCMAENSVNQYNINKFSNILNYTEQVQDTSNPNELCVVYDMDNTILAAEPNVGGDSWMSWNNNLKSNDINKITNWDLSADLHGFEGSLRFFIKYHPTEKDTLATINEIKDTQKHPSIVMTARSYERYFAATNNQLLANKMNFTTNPIGITGNESSPLTLIPNKNHNAYKAYFNGVYYSAEDNKGVEILSLIKEQRKQTGDNSLCQTTIFIDNSMSNVKNVYNAFLNNSQNPNLIALHYTGYDDYLDPKPDVIKSWSIENKGSTGEQLYKLIKNLNN